MSSPVIVSVFFCVVGPVLIKYCRCWVVLRHFSGIVVLPQSPDNCKPDTRKYISTLEMDLFRPGID